MRFDNKEKTKEFYDTLVVGNLNCTLNIKSGILFTYLNSDTDEIARTFCGFLVIYTGKKSRMSKINTAETDGHSKIGTDALASILPPPSAFSAELSPADLERFFEMLSCAVFVLDGLAHTVHRNGAARTLLQQGQLIRLTDDGLPFFVDQHANKFLCRLVTALTTGQVSKISQEFYPLSANNARLYRVAIVPLGEERNVAAALGDQQGAGRPVIILCIEPTRPTPQLTKQILNHRYGLTYTEREVTWALYKGGSPADIARSRGVSVNTVRNQIKSAYAKTETSRLSDLIKMVAEIDNARADLAAP